VPARAIEKLYQFQYVGTLKRPGSRADRRTIQDPPLSRERRVKALASLREGREQDLKSGGGKGDHDRWGGAASKEKNFKGNSLMVSERGK